MHSHTSSVMFLGVIGPFGFRNMVRCRPGDPVSSDQTLGNVCMARTSSLQPSRGLCQLPQLLMTFACNASYLKDAQSKWSTNNRNADIFIDNIYYNLHHDGHLLWTPHTSNIDRASTGRNMVVPWVYQFPPTSTRTRWNTELCRPSQASFQATGSNAWMTPGSRFKQENLRRSHPTSTKQINMLNSHEKM